MASIVKKLKSVLGSRLPLFLDCKMVIVVRTDIPMGKGKIAAQCSHAAVECYRIVTSVEKYQQVFHSWMKLGQPKIVLQVQSEALLLNLAEEARAAGLPAAVIRDAGKTQLEPGTISVLGIGPAPKNHVDRITSSLKLL